MTVHRPLFATPATTMRTRADRSVLLASRIELAPYPRTVGELVDSAARAAPDRVLVGQRTAGGGWRAVSYGTARAAVDSIGLELAVPVRYMLTRYATTAGPRRGCPPRGDVRPTRARSIIHYAAIAADRTVLVTPSDAE